MGPAAHGSTSELLLREDGLIANILAFNVGVEIGQLLALTVLVFVVMSLRATRRFARYAGAFNVLLMFAGFLLAGYQFAGLAVAAV